MVKEAVSFLEKDNVAGDGLDQVAGAFGRTNFCRFEAGIDQAGLGEGGEGELLWPVVRDLSIGLECR